MGNEGGGGGGGGGVLIFKAPGSSFLHPMKRTDPVSTIKIE